jgi:hypothetical protein
MSDTIDLEARGLIEMQRKTEQMISDLGGGPVLQAMRDSTLAVERFAKQNLVGYQSPEVGGVDTGVLRASITPGISMEGATFVGVVGSNLKYAPFVEFDTRPHWPPIKALETWAKRHGAVAFLVARAISIRGTIGKHFLQRAFDSAKDYIKHRFEQAVEELVKK